MATAPPHEQTPLLAGTKTNQFVDQSPPRSYKKQNRYCHIIATAAITLLVALAIGATIYFFLLKNKDETDPVYLYRKALANEYARENDNSDLKMLLGNSWPRIDALQTSYPATNYITIIQEAIDQGKENLKKVKNETQSETTSNEGSSTTEGTKVMAARTSKTDSNAVTESSSGSSSSTTSELKKNEDTNSTSDNASKLSDYGFIENEASKYLREKKHIPGIINYNGTKDLKWSNETGCSNLSVNVTCKPSPYRTVDGFCNNKKNPWWGTAMKPFRRALPADYADELSEPRGAFNSNLPSPLDVSAHIEASHSGDKKFSEMLSVWGDFIHHDISVVAGGIDSQMLNCCRSENKSSECFPVIGNSTEEQNETCFNFVRSMAALRCSFGPREQLNEVSSFMDGSLIYGNTEYLNSELRAYRDGLLDASHERESGIWIPPLRAAVEGYDPEGSWGASFHPERPPMFWHPEMSSHPSYNPAGAWKPPYDPNGPWKLSYDPESHWKESHDRKEPWRSWYERSVPWALAQEEEGSWRLKRSSDKHGKGQRYYSPLGDIRPSEYAQAASMRSVLVRQHNRVAQTLQALHPDWSDETIFQEAKRIVTAQIQHITYNEFLPNILGEELMQKLQLYPKREGYWTLYNESIDPTVSNHFAVATSRLSRAIIERMLARQSTTKEWETKFMNNIQREVNEIKSDVENEKKENESWYKRSFQIFKGNLDSLIKGIMNNNSTSGNSTETSTEISTETSTATTTKTSTENSSTSSTTESSGSSTENETDSTNSKRKKRSTGFVLDSAAYDVQRGRDHGLPAYTEWRKYCNLSEVNSFNDLTYIFNPEALKNISKMYWSVHDIDLYTGALAERPMSGSVVGPTSACLLADQYYRSKHGDRYWYETHEKPQAFTQSQLGEIRKTSLGGILCANIDHLSYVPTHVMWMLDSNNKFVACSDVEQPDLSHWGSSAGFDGSQNTVVDENKKDGLKQAEKKFNYVKSYLDGIDTTKIRLTDTSLHSELPSYVSDWISNRSSSADTALKYELNQLENRPGFYGNKLIPTYCNITVQTRHVEIFHKKKMSFEPPREILVDVFHNQMLVWSPNASNSLQYGFKILNKTGDFVLDLEGALYDLSKCLDFQPECVYYSKVVLGDVADEKDLFEVSVSTVADPCSVIAPVLMQGYYVDEQTFYWTGGITVLVSESKGLSKEDELSFSPPVRRSWFQLPKLNGSLTLRDHGKWDGHLPVVLDGAALSWYRTEDTLVYPVSWSGFYDGFAFEGVFLLPEKRADKIKWYDGEFSLILPVTTPDLFKDMIQKDRVYSSVVYLTSNPEGVDRFDVSEFNKIHDWVFADYSQILITGHFDQNGRFHWSGDISIRMSPPKIEYPSTTYRPYGKYLFKVLEGELFSQVGYSAPVQRWWSGVLPSRVIVPGGKYDEKLSAHILDQYVIWSYDNFTVSDGNGTFRIHQSRSQMGLWGSFEFQYSYLMEAIWTSVLKSGVTYYSPILLQYDRMTYDFGDDMPERMLLNFQRPDFGVLAPITLLGEFHNKTAFSWNTEILVTVVEK